MSKTLKTEQEVMQALNDGCVLVDNDGDKYKMIANVIMYKTPEYSWEIYISNEFSILQYDPKILKPKKKKEKTWFYSIMINIDNSTGNLDGIIVGDDFDSAYKSCIEMLNNQGYKKEHIVFTAFNRV